MYTDRRILLAVILTILAIVIATAPTPKRRCDIRDDNCPGYEGQCP